MKLTHGTDGLLMDCGLWLTKRTSNREGKMSSAIIIAPGYAIPRVHTHKICR
jgi:hypothetical protein